MTATHGEVSVALADDHAVVRSGLRMLLESEQDLAVVAEVGDLDELLLLVRDAPPDVLLLDVHMRGGSSLRLIPSLAERTSVLVLTMQDDPGYARTAMLSGARGYVLKEAEDAEVLHILRLIALGHTNAEIADQLFLSVRTVETHRANIHRKLGTDNRAQLVQHALEWGLVRP